MPLVACPDCRSELSDKATACVKCGRPMGEPPGKKRGGVCGCVLTTFAAMTVFGLVIGGIVALTNKEGPDSTATRPTVAIDSTFLRKCTKAVEGMQRAGAIGGISYYTVSTVEFRPPGYILSYQEKNGLAVAISYVARSHGFENSSVKFLDSQTNRKVGMYNGYTGQLDWSGQ
jgi:hypothetical protein